ncbi:MAG: hypothetical protein F2793_09620 [Actinobacteria bacterium]|uniref:Unannotated protein n=1 Tax=freshwater metagenome TaxID=449393 RepID=A0A6J7F466_9ZZZZ|nr:hypothetical protein [Actinomycetota bacterium]
MTAVIRAADSAVGNDATCTALREVAEQLAVATTAVAVVADDLVIADAALAQITADPFAGTSMLVRPARDGDTRVRHHVVNSVGSSFHAVTTPDHVFVGALVIAPKDAEVVGRSITATADALGAGELGAGPHDATQLVAVAIIRSGTLCRAVELVDVPWFRGPADRAAALVEVGACSDERIAQLQANRMDDGFYSTFVVRRLSKPLTRLALRLRMSPNTVTLISFAVGLAAAGAFAMGERWALVIGAVLLQLSLVIDCVDGEVARATRRFSALGAWLDASTDRVKEYLAYAGLAIGAAAVSGVNIWPLAIIMLVLQTTRHMTDYDFSRVQRSREARVTPRPVTDADDADAGGTAGWSVQSAVDLSSRVNRRSGVRWAKRAIHMPIGERWLVISLGAALLGATWALGLLLGLGIVALAYVTAGRVLRTLTWSGPAPADAGLLLARQSDAGPIAALLARGMSTAGWQQFWAAPAAWAVPAALRFIELGIVALLALAFFPSAMVLAFWWMAIIAFHHYDVLYRAIAGVATPRWLVWSGLGWDGRTILILIAAAGGIAVFSGMLLAGVVVWSLLLIVVASIQWLASGQVES